MINYFLGIIQDIMLIYLQSDVSSMQNKHVYYELFWLHQVNLGDFFPPKSKTWITQKL